jgi:hypothetical protein
VKYPDQFNASVTACPDNGDFQHFISPLVLPQRRRGTEEILTHPQKSTP